MTWVRTGDDTTPHGFGHAIVSEWRGHTGSPCGIHRMTVEQSTRAAGLLPELRARVVVDADRGGNGGYAEVSMYFDTIEDAERAGERLIAGAALADLFAALRGQTAAKGEG